MCRKNQRLLPSGFGTLLEGLIPLLVLAFSFAVAFPIIAYIRKHHAVILAQHWMLYIALTWALIALYYLASSKLSTGSRAKNITEYLGFLAVVYVCITLALFVMSALQLLVWRTRHQL